jgi:hypothetical protein
MHLVNRTIIFDNKEFFVQSADFNSNKTVVSLVVKDVVSNKIHLISIPTNKLMV